MAEISADESLAEDQQKINTFSKLNTRLSDIQDQLKTKLVSAECELEECWPLEAMGV
jgi:chaperonin cofactor prefoldin